MKVALFVRVSRQEQSYQRQVSELTEYAKSLNYQVARVIEEKISGSKIKLENRPGIQDLFDLVATGQVSKVLISEVSRLGRRTKDLLEIIEFLHHHKVSLVVYNYQLETLDHKGRVNSMAQFLITLLGDIGRMEAETLSERTISGLEEAKRKGKTLGRKKGTTQTDEQLLAKYKGVAKDLKAGKTLRDVAAIRGVAINTVRKVKAAAASDWINKILRN